MQWRSLTSIPNLKLAWRRINTGRNLQYKRFFREAFLVYEAGLDESLKDLKTRLEAGAWKPSHAHRVYLPKPSGLQRPLSFLELEDQIILQAIANQFANRLRKRRKKLEGDTVFSDVHRLDRTMCVALVRSCGGALRLNQVDRGWQSLAFPDSVGSSKVRGRGKRVGL